VIVARFLAEVVRKVESGKRPKSDKEMFLIERLMILRELGQSPLL
jgi:hypothetical protein